MVRTAWCLLSFVGLISMGIAQHHEDLGSFEDYPDKDEVWMGAQLAEVSMNPLVPLETTKVGGIDWRVADGTFVEEGTVVAVCGVEEIKLSERDLQLRHEKNRNDLIDLEQANYDSRKAVLASMLEAEEKLGRMTLTKGEKELLGAEFEGKLEVERQELREEIELYREKLDGDYFDLALAAEKKLLKLELDRAEFDYAKLLREGELVAPVAGVVHIEERKPLRVPGQIGSVERRRVAEAMVELADSRLRRLAGEVLVLEVSSDDGRWFRANYSRTLERTSLNQDARIAVFELVMDGEEQVQPEAMNGRRMVKILRRLDRAGKIVPKEDILFRHPEEIRDFGWAKFVENRWSGVQVTYVAPRDLVVERVDEN